MSKRSAAYKAADKKGMSHHSYDTDDTITAELAVTTNSGQINTESLARSDRPADGRCPIDTIRGGNRRTSAQSVACCG
ncbi:hypothetical protein [Stappia stellulata]|uniref:hypothetical protein n=1 Tax=Stappia stellulata TaxID=71235 RepID=UPI0024801B6F|nr:hypothetical protein [Stappia stellulata]